MQAERQTGRQRALISYIVTFGHFSTFILYKKNVALFFFFGKATTVIKCERAISSLCELLRRSDLGIFQITMEHLTELLVKQVHF